MEGFVGEGVFLFFVKREGVETRAKESGGLSSVKSVSGGKGAGDSDPGGQWADISEEAVEDAPHARVGVFPDRLESASRQDARGKCRQESFPFVQVRVFYVMSYGVHLKTKPGAPGSSLLASRECRKEALQAYLAWCQDQGLNVNIREFTRSPLPGFIPRASVTEAAIDSTPGASAAAASHMD